LSSGLLHYVVEPGHGAPAKQNSTETLDMNLKRTFQMVAAGTALLLLAAELPASAETCFTAFNGGNHFQFSQSRAAFTTPGQRVVNGVVFGSALFACAGLKRWPLIGAVQVDHAGSVLAFRAFEVDAKSCGAVDFIVDLNSTTLSGPLQLHNDRNNFSSTSTLVEAACITPPAAAEAEGAPEAAPGRDAVGN
jgi:hypothetical protein